jgi:integrase
MDSLARRTSAFQTILEVTTVAESQENHGGVAGIEQGVHSLRHTFCSLLAMKGRARAAIQELAGHADPLPVLFSSVPGALSAPPALRGTT